MTLVTTTACCLVGEGLIGVLLDGGIGRLVVHLDYVAGRCVDGDPLVWGVPLRFSICWGQRTLARVSHRVLVASIYC